MLIFIKFYEFYVNIAVMADSSFVKIHLYKVRSSTTASAVDICRKLSEQTQEKRLRVVGRYSMKMEKLADFPPDGEGVFADFCKQRYHGPGLSSRQSETTNFDMEADESFGEMTAMLFIKGGHALVQYNHYGPRAAVIAKYISECSSSGGELAFVPVVKGDWLRKITNAQSVNWVEAKFNFAGMGHLPREFEKEATFASIFKTMNSIDEVNAARIEIKVSKRRGGSPGMDRQECRDFLQKAVDLNEQDNEILTSARVEVAGEGGSEILDLINGREEIEVHLEVDKNERMIPFEKRQFALAQAYIHWRNKGFFE